MLLRPFPLQQHEWHRGFVYIEERAINARLAQVDPSFEYIILHYEHRTIQASVHARLTICGVARDAIGMASVVKAKDGVGEVGEPEKSADTDALKRCARKHGVGLYLLDAPGEQEFAGWLEGQVAAWQRRYDTQMQRAPDQDTGEIITVQAEVVTATPPPAPHAKNELLSPDAVNSLVLEAKRKGVTPEQLLAALGCTERWSEYKGTLSEARATLDKAAKALKARPAPPADGTELHF